MVSKVLLNIRSYQQGVYLEQGGRVVKLVDAVVAVCVVGLYCIILCYQYSMKQ